MQIPELPPPEIPLAFLTTLDAHADACLVWPPGQQAPEEISPPGSLGARLSGCFVLFVPQQEATARTCSRTASRACSRIAAGRRFVTLATRAPGSIPGMDGKRSRSSGSHQRRGSPGTRARSAAGRNAAV
jgi:hypothetical protein